MSNIKRIIGKPPKPRKTIGDMNTGDTGYTTPWTYDEWEGLNKSGSIRDKKGGTASLWVECIAPGEYVIEFEKAKYRKLFIGK